MNRDGGAYQLSDIYDAVIAKTTASGDRKISGSLQFANQRPMKMYELWTSKLSQLIPLLDVIQELSNCIM